MSDAMRDAARKPGLLGISYPWALYLNQDQRYLGRMYAWLLREGDMQRLSQLNDEEWRSLRIAMGQYESVMQELWQPDHINYAWLGNHMHMHSGHGHMHLIPRYKNPREFAGVTFVDQRWGANYAPYEPFKVPDTVFHDIQETLSMRFFDPFIG